jgi:hypothetical protein
MKCEIQNDSSNTKNHEFRSQSHLFDQMYQEYDEVIHIQTANLRKIKTLMKQRTYQVVKIVIFKQTTLKKY